jgi:pyruvate kinase
MISSSVSRVQAESFVADGDMVVITAGVTVGRTGATNLLKVHIVGEDVRM